MTCAKSSGSLPKNMFVRLVHSTGAILSTLLSMDVHRRQMNPACSPHCSYNTPLFWRPVLIV